MEVLCTDTCERRLGFESPDSGEYTPSPEGCNSQELSPLDYSKKNKRKSSEPRKRTDFSIKRICQSPGGSVDSDSGCSEDIERNSHRSDSVNKREAERSCEPVSDLRRSTPILKVPYPNINVPYFVPQPASYYMGKPFPPPPPPASLNFPSYQGMQHTQYSPEIRHRLQPEEMSPSSETVSRFNSGANRQSSDSFNPETLEKSGKKQRKNYKNMTRERRIEANARERTRVHTISAAFESLRRAVPSYSYNQKLSKLAILRIACSYILALARLADLDYSPDKNNASFAECVDLCTQTIQTEGRARRRH